MNVITQVEAVTRPVNYTLQTKTVLDFINMRVSGQLNLSPGFQRESVWKEPQRAALIESMLRGYPIPAIFLCVHHDGGNPTYDVIDGKQRLESILKFCGKMPGGFSTKVQLFADGEIRDVNWKLLQKSQLRHLIEQFQVSVVQVEGELGDVINLFVRINSTGSALTMQERRKAKFFKSPILTKAQQLAEKLEKDLKSRGILNQSQITRMKHVELACELMLSATQGGAVLNKKSALDRILTTNSLDAKQLQRATISVVRCVKLVAAILPGIKTTRFRKLSDFYSLCCLFMKFEAERLVLNDAHKNAVAGQLLTELSAEVDAVAERQKKAKGIDEGKEVYRDYLLTVQQATDEVGQRRKREKILDIPRLIETAKKSVAEL